MIHHSETEILKEKIKGLEHRIQQLEKDGEPYAEMFSRFPDLLCIADITTARFLKINPAFSNLLGYTEEELLRRSFLEFIHPDDIQPTRDIIDENLKAGKKILDFANRYRCSDGTYRWLDWTSHPMPEKGITFAVAHDITRLKRMETTLTENEMFIRTVMDHLPLGIAVNSIDPAVTFEYINDNFPRLYRTTKEAISKPDGFWSAVYEDPVLREKIKKQVLDDCSSGDPEKMIWEDVPITREHEETTYITARNIPIPSKGLMISVVWDVTKKKTTEAALQETKRLLENTQSLARFGGWEYTLETSNLIWTDEIFRIHGMDEFKNPVDLNHAISFYEPDSAETITNAFQNLIHNLEPYDLEVKLKRADNRTIWVRTMGRPVLENGRIIGAAGNIMDITDRKSAEERLRQSHELLSNLARLVPSVIFQYRLFPDGTSCFPYASPGMNDIYEVTPEEVVKDAAPVFSRLHPDDYDQVVHAIQQSAHTLQTFYCEFKVILPRQGLRWRWSQAHPERLEDGSILWHGIVSDVTERKQAEQEKEKLQAQLSQAQKMEAVGTLAGGIAHDFNNMLSIILGNAEMILEDLGSSNPLAAGLQEIRKAAERSADLTRQLLAFARKQTVSPKILDLNTAIEGILKMLRRLIGENIDLLWLPGENLRTVKIDPSQIDQILANLCVNARDAIKDIGKITIETGNARFDADHCRDNEGFRPGDYVMVAVSDTGCGIDKKEQENIFDPFFTTKPKGKGTGLGLSTVYGIVKQNNGFIKLYSEIDKGTTFKIYLPWHIEKEGPEDRKQIEHGVLKGHETVLLVEDETAILQMTRQMLERLGYNVLAASTPEEAIRMCQSPDTAIDLLMTDVVMPAMNGRTLAERLSHSRPRMKLLYMSGYTANVIAHHGVLDKGVNFINKPFSKQDLSQKLREILGD